MTDARRRDTATTFTAAATGFCELVRQVPTDAWSRPALGVWDIRGLVGHASRSLAAVDGYLGLPPTDDRVDGPIAYYLDARTADAGAIAARGVQAGAALGDDPAAAVDELARRALDALDGAADDATITTPWGSTMTLTGYLPTRTFELAVHSLDLARALDVGPPASLSPAVAASCELAGQLAARQTNAATVLLALTGRLDLPVPLAIF